MQNKATVYRLNPTKEQKLFFERTFGCCRKIWNLMRTDCQALYRETGRKNVCKTPAQYKKDYPYLKEVDSLALANVWLNLRKAYNKYFQEPNIDLPKFKSKKKTRPSYTTNNQHDSIRLVKNGIRLPKVGIIKAVIHRWPKQDWKLKSATVYRDTDGKYYVSVLFEFEDRCAQYEINENNVIGLDYKSDGLYMDSNGHIGSNHKYFRESQKKLKKAQRKLKHKIVGSRNYEKQQKRIGKIHEHIVSQRKDNLHKLSTEIANQYDIVCVESLNMKSLSNRRFGNGKATLDNGWGMFISMLDYKLKDRGKLLIKIDKWYPSTQICSNCGFQQKMELKERTYKCPFCGQIIDRDLNSAINIKNEGIRMLEESMIA